MQLAQNSSSTRFDVTQPHCSLNLASPLAVVPNGTGWVLDLLFLEVALFISKLYRYQPVSLLPNSISS